MSTCTGPTPARALSVGDAEAGARLLINPGKVFDLTTDLDHTADAYAAMDGEPSRHSSR